MGTNKQNNLTVGMSERAEVMTVEAAARALGFLARWAARRLQQRLSGSELGSGDVVTSENTTEYGPASGEN